MKYVVEIAWNTQDGVEWTAVRPSGGKPYIFDSEEEARDFRNRWYPLVSDDRARVRRIE